MCVERPSARLKKPLAHTQVYARGGKGNAMLLAWDCGQVSYFVQPRGSESNELNISLTKTINPNHSLLSKPTTVRRIGRIIRRIEEIT